MIAAGIIAEYNPFHNGHAYQIQKTKELSHADYIIAAISGNFVQRGAPAILDKFTRTYEALANGADFVFEIPVLFATASAEYFAAAGIALLSALGCIDLVSFGCETPDLMLLSKIAEILENEPLEYKTFLASYLKQGIPFPAAREKAMLSYIPGQKGGVSAILSAPNNILALEYIKALRQQKSSIRPFPILRNDSGYHATDFKQKYCSASAIRNLLLNEKEQIQRHGSLAKTLSKYVPLQTAGHLLSPDAKFLTEQDFSKILYYKLLMERESGFYGYADVSREFSNRLIRALSGFTDYESFCRILKSKEITYTRISRCLFHILLNIKTTDYENAKTHGRIPYLRLLGFRKEAAPFFREIKKHAKVPLLTRPSKYASSLDKSAASMFLKDAAASDLYYGMLAQKSSAAQKNEYQRSLVIF